jgi:radical SAM superfamily enzyme YgiQ (UPF0313 family)
LRNPGEILLVSCFELGHQPLGVALPAAFLQRAGFAPAAIDLAVQSLDPEAIRRARLVAISVPMHTALRLGVRAAGRVRELNPAAHICFFGLYATLNADHLLARHGDSVLGGETEEELTRLAQRLESGADVSATAPGPTLGRLDFPRPARALLPSIDRYARLVHKGEKRIAGAVESSRGCLHTCRHCPITPVYQGRFFVLPRDVVLADIAQQIEAGARHITFADPDFLNGPKHALSIVRAMHERWPEVTFDVTIKVEHILERRDVLAELGRCGCLFIVSAFESLSDRVLEILDKGHTARDLSVAVRLLEDAGIDVRPTFVPFTPWDSIESRLRLFQFIEEEDLVDRVDPIQLTLRLLVPPGSPLAVHDAMKPHLAGLVPDAFSHRWVHPDPRMDALAADSARLLKEGVQQGRDDRSLFRALRDQTLAVAGLQHPPEAAQRREPRGEAPRLTESWFCCAEPNDDQLTF